MGNVWLVAIRGTGLGQRVPKASLTMDVSPPAVLLLSQADVRQLCGKVPTSRSCSKWHSLGILGAFSQQVFGGETSREGPEANGLPLDLHLQAPALLPACGGGKAANISLSSDF